MDLVWIIACTVVVAIGFTALAVFGFKLKKWGHFTIVFIILLLTSLGVRVSGLYFNNLYGWEGYEINLGILIFKSLYSIIGGLQFEGIDDIAFNRFDWYNCFLLPLYYILPIIVGLLTLAKLSQSLVYEYYCKIKWGFSVVLKKHRPEIYVFTSLTDESLQLARSTFKKNTKSTIIFYGNHIPAFDNHNLLCRRIRSYGWYYFTNSDGKKKYKDSMELKDSDRRFESSILNKLHLVKRNYMKLCIISMHLNEDLTPNDELNLDISYREYQTYIDCILKHCLGEDFFKNRTLYLFLYYSDFIKNRSADPDIDTVKERLITLYNQLIESNSTNAIIKEFLKDPWPYFKGPYNFCRSRTNIDLKIIDNLVEMLLESKKCKRKFNEFLKEKRISFEKKLKTFSKTLELYTLVGKEINYQAYQQTIDDFKDQVKMYLGVPSKNGDYDVNEVYCPPEFYILNEASLVADDLIESINECNKLCQFDDDNKKITKGVVVGFGEIGQNTLHNLYTQYNIESENVVFDIYDSKADNYVPSCYVSSEYCSWECDETLYDYKINHPYFKYVLAEPSGLSCRRDDYKDTDEDMVGENTHVDEKAILNDLLTLRLSSTKNLYEILDGNSGTKFDEEKDIIVLTTGSDDKNIKYANFLINDIEHELFFNDGYSKFKQIIAVNIRKDINNSLLNLDGFIRITKNVYRRKVGKGNPCLTDIYVIIFGNTDEVYSYKLLDHETDKNYNYGYNLIYDGINGATSTEIDVKELKGLAKDYFNNPNLINGVEKYYEDIVNYFTNISGSKYEPKPGEVAMREKLWKNNNIFDCLSNKSARLFSNNFKCNVKKDPHGREYLRENIIREHNRWFRFYICYGWRYRFRKSKPNKKHDCLINIKWVPEDKRFFDIINVAYSLAVVDLKQMTKNFKNAEKVEKVKKSKEKRNESNKNNPDRLETNGQATEEIKRN